MAKTRDTEPLLREFNHTFNRLSYRHDWSRVWSDFVEWMLLGYTLSIGEAKERLDRRNHDLLSKYNEEERRLLPVMLRQFLNASAAGIEHDPAYDPFGDYYQELTSRGKAASMGQFFTPTPICDFMSGMVAPMSSDATFAELAAKGTAGDEDMGMVLIVADPACGSGRTLMSFHKYNLHRTVYYYGQDRDPICARMCALNMMMHGMNGEVIIGDSLAWRFDTGYRINPWLDSLGFPCIAPMSGPHDSYSHGGSPLMFARWREHASELSRTSRTPQRVLQDQQKKFGPPTSGGQLTLF